MGIQFLKGVFYERQDIQCKRDKRLVKDTLEGNPLLSNFFLKGEISGVNYYKSGHLYFNLKDKNLRLNVLPLTIGIRKYQRTLKKGI